MGLLRRNALSVLRASIKACDPLYAVKKHLKVQGRALSVGRFFYDLEEVRRIFIIGAGKASARMAFALEEILDERISSGIVITKKGHLVPLKRVELVEGARKEGGLISQRR